MRRLLFSLAAVCCLTVFAGCCCSHIAGRCDCCGDCHCCNGVDPNGHGGCGCAGCGWNGDHGHADGHSVWANGAPEAPVQYTAPLQNAAPLPK
jgi:hypothetical protein